MLVLDPNPWDIKKGLQVLRFITQRLPEVKGEEFETLTRQILYLADKLHLEKYGCLIYGERYISFEDKPLPLYAMFVWRSRPFYWLLMPPDMDYLSESDEECLLSIIAEANAMDVRDICRNLRELCMDEAVTGTADDTIINLEDIARTLPCADDLIAHLRGE